MRHAPTNATLAETTRALVTWRTAIMKFRGASPGYRFRENPMARKKSSNGASVAKEFLPALRSVRKGDFSGRLSVDQTGVAAEFAEVFNDLVELMDSSTRELDRISRVVGKEGK